MTGRSNVHIKAEVERFPSYHHYCSKVKVFILLETPVTCFHEKKYKNKKQTQHWKKTYQLVKGMKAWSAWLPCNLS